MTTPEGKIKQKIAHVLNKHGAWSFMPVPTGYQKKTIDFFVCCKGWFIGIEAKAGKAATPRQEYILGLIREAGGQAIVVKNDYDVEQLDEMLMLLKHRGQP